MADQQVPAWAKPVIPMSPDNAAKMNDLYPEDNTPSWAKKSVPSWVKPASPTTPAPSWAKKEPGTIEEIGARETRILDSAGKGIKDAMTKPLTEAGNPVAKLGEVGGRAADVAGNIIKGAVSPVAATGAELLKPAAKPLATYVAGKEGANPQQAEDIGEKLKGSTADVLGDTLANTVAGAAGGAEIPKEGMLPKEIAQKKDLGEVVNTPLQSLDNNVSEKIASAAKRDAGGVKTGAKHADIPGTGEEGFVTNKGRFVTREEADKLAKASSQIVRKPVEPGQLHSEDIGRPVPRTESKIFTPEQPLASTKSISTPAGVADKLYQQRSSIRADYKDFTKWAKPFKDVPESFWKKALDHLDDPKGVPLNPQEKIIFDRSIGVLKDEIDANRKEIKASGFSPTYLQEGSDSLGGAIRQRKGAGTPMDRLTGTETAARAPEGGRSLSRSAGTFKGRNMMALTRDGERQVVHIDKDGNIFDASKKGDPLGHYDPTDDAVVMTDGKPAKLGEATRKEIESATDGAVSYHDNAFGVYATTLLQTRRALRSVRVLNDIKKSPEFNEVAHAPFTKDKPPAGWREIPDAPEFKGWKFEPRYAEEIEDFVKGTKRDAGTLNWADKLNKFVLNTLFWVNPVHAYNITDAFLTTKGLGGLAKDLPGTTSDLLKSVKSIATRDKYAMQQARAGVPMPGLDTAGEEFRRMTTDIMGVKARQDPKGFLQFAKEFGYDDPKEFLSRVSEVSHKAVFSWQDVLQQTLERGYMRQGLSQAEATEKAAKTFMDYRTPARVMDQRWMGQALQGQAWLDFPKYSYGRLKGIYSILKGSAKLDPHAIDQLIMIGALYEFGQHALNPLLKQYTGQDNAEFGNYGYTLFPDLVDKVTNGQRSPGQALQGLAAPGYAIQGLDMARGTDPYTGKPIAVPGESSGEVMLDYAGAAANKFSPMQRMGQVAKGNITPEDVWLQQLGVKFPAELPKSVRRELKTREKYGSQIEQELGQ